MLISTPIGKVFDESSSPNGTEAVSNLEHFANAFFPMDVTDLGITIDSKLEQLSNACSPIEITEFGIVIDVNAEQAQNA